MINATIKLLAILMLSWLLAGCGGGGGGAQLPPVDENQPPMQQVGPPVDVHLDPPADPDPVVPDPPALVGNWLSDVYDQLPQPGVAFSPYNDAIHQTTAQQILALTNAERTTEGLGPLIGDSHLDRVAQAHAMDMADSGYFNHDNLFGMSPFDRMDAVNPPEWVSAGENIAAGQPTAQAVVQGWMDSPGHRENILRKSFVYMGVGVYNDPDSPYGVYYVQSFAAFASDPVTHAWYEPGV